MAVGGIDGRRRGKREKGKEPVSEPISKTANFIASGTFRRVALQFPDSLLREAPEVLWTLQARLRKLVAARGEGEDGGAEQPLIFVTGDTSYGSCCVDEVAAQHLKADAIIHYGRACLSPTNSSVPVLYVFGREDVDVEDLAAMLLSGPLSAPSKAPVLLLYDVTYAYAISDLLKTLGDEATRDGKLEIGLPTTDVYSFTKKGSMAEGASRVGEGCKCGATSSRLSARQVKPSNDSPGDEQKGCCSLGVAACYDSNTVDLDAEREGSGAPKNGPAATTSGEGVLSSQPSEPTVGTAGTTDLSGGVKAAECSSSISTPTCRKVEDLSGASGGSAASGSCLEAPLVVSRTRFRIGGLVVGLESEDALKQHALVFVGGEGRQLSNVLLRCTGCTDRLRYDPALPPGQRVVQDAKKSNRDLMRRYYLVQRAKEASVVGIVVGTLGVQRYGDVVRSLRKMVEDAGRKAYTLAVGKVNVAKLANFAEIEVFCLVACAENTLLDSKEFHAPVVTPLELEVALGRREWDGFYSTDFDDLGETSVSSKTDIGDAAVANGSALGSLTLGAKRADNANNVDEDDRPFFSLVTGSFKNNPGVSRREAHLEQGKHGESDGSGALVRLGNRSLMEWSSPAADFLDQRHYKGLEALVGETEAKPATQGQSGIASDYGGV